MLLELDASIVPDVVAKRYGLGGRLGGSFWSLFTVESLMSLSGMMKFEVVRTKSAYLQIEIHP